ncbi:serine/threonine protein phosphatase [Cellulophaga baltica]|uniref:metallophosphoesterase family protein n=1 Tax=Cellulophaga baltica TaxID=76594 RepID=UPI0021493F03|nr:metallophosphoesterase family protein [Cellulophaga baltica]MCR1025588.1 serine/threonine protein phosphatase [Cellulophaga baltica]
MRVLAIGDIHSGLKALEQVLAKAEVTTEDQLIFLGDYVDGWSQATETINYLIGLKKTHNCIFIRGNHDELCKSWLTEGKDNPTWYQHGGEATANSYANLDKRSKELHIDFFNTLEDYYLDEDKRLFLHAGFTNLKGVDFEYFSKTFYWDRTLWELVLSLNPNLTPDHEYYPQRLIHYSEIFIGHTPVTRIGKTTPQNAANVWNVDTGAAFKGPLSVIDIETKQVWQSDPVYTFYPDEKGRN